MNVGLSIGRSCQTSAKICIIIYQQRQRQRIFKLLKTENEL